MISNPYVGRSWRHLSKGRSPTFIECQDFSSGVAFVHIYGFAGGMFAFPVAHGLEKLATVRGAFRYRSHAGNDNGIGGL
jgi:hypothetical protein